MPTRHKVIPQKRRRQKQQTSAWIKQVHQHGSCPIGP